MLTIPDTLHPICLPEDSPFHRGGTCLYLVGKGSLVLVDTGNVDQVGSQAVLEYLAAHPGLGRLAHIVITHNHRDHVAGLPIIHEAMRRAGMPPAVLAHPLAVDGLRRDWDFPFALPLKEGQHLQVGGVDLTVHYTPGHCLDHICLFEPATGTLFSGDLVLGASTSWVSDLRLALASLRRMLSLRPKLLCPGHGPMQEDAIRRIRTYLAHRYLRERQILRQLLRGPKTAADLTALIYPRIDPLLRNAAERNILAHLDKLRHDGRVEVAGDPPLFTLIGAVVSSRDR